MQGEADEEQRERSAVYGVWRGVLALQLVELTSVANHAARPAERPVCELRDYEVVVHAVLVAQRRSARPLEA